ncbi:hypothetical protein [Amycolatopsis sp. GA6-003]|uniref:hypothetical protein n=1 Tax=Amycolatopsis sp. GA6-003 TaxID=2652444 RepID=UPI003916CE2A
MDDNEQALPELKDWPTRSNTLGFLPGRSSAQVETLRKVLEQLPLAPSDEIEVTYTRAGHRRIPCERLMMSQLSRGSFAAAETTGAGIRHRRSFNGYRPRTIFSWHTISMQT